ncbi:hypothetical protein BCR44DRAFT_1438852 [Catenaria anguillulae PL171]|uniref:G-protein coupled receptors family 3 profile domain-containing protein n=1 Tax=Catenaria anguillulae PL171 TaxID=765915 RepID=A0A1Y2HJ89_9FUNG|nr:hypothetical protein BCR44DRAFT_1438852 [Catenaria anguillulae PL171]
MGRGILKIVNATSATDVLARSYHPNLQRFFLEDPFEGVTGQVLFDKDGNRRSPFQVYNWWNGIATPVYDVLPDSSVVQRAPVRFYSGKPTVPRDRPEQLALVPTLDSATGIALLVANCIVAAAICVVWGYLVYYRHDPTVLALSFPFLNLITLGCVLLGSWLFAFGFELVVVSSAAKAFRLWRIFHNTFLKIGQFDTKKLFMGVLVVLAGQSFIFIVWSAVGPQTPVLINSRTYYHYRCSSQSTSVQTAFAAVSTVYNGILLAALIFLAYKTRTIQTNYRETSWMLYVSQNSILSGIVIMTFHVFQFGEATLAAFVVKQTTIMYAVTFAFAALVGRIAIVAHHTHTKGQHAGASVARALMSNSVVGSAPAVPHAKGTRGGKQLGGESLAIKTLEVRTLPAVSSPAFEGTQVSGGAGISENSEVVCRGVYPVKRLGSLFATWHMNQICIFSKDGYLTLIPNQQADAGPVFGTTLLLQQIRYDPSPSGLENCLEIACGNLAWLIQFSSERERDTWVSLLAATATSKVSRQSSKSSLRKSSKEVGRSPRVGAGSGKRANMSSSSGNDRDAGY